MALFTKSKNIVITPKVDYAIWEVNLQDCGENATFSVGSGCSAVKLVNGCFAAEDVVSDGKARRVFRKGENASNVKIVAMNNRTETFILFGVTDLQYRDGKYGTKTNDFGLHGKMRVEVLPKFTAFIDRGEYTVRTDAMKQRIDNELRQVVKEQFAKYSANVEYAKIDSIQTPICDAVKLEMQDKIEKMCLPIFVTSVIIEGFNPGDEFEENYKNGGRKVGNDPYTIQIPAGVLQEKKEEAFNLKSFLDGCREEKETPSEKQEGEEVPQKDNECIICPRCKHRNPADAVHCNKCGKQLK